MEGGRAVSQARAVLREELEGRVDRAATSCSGVLTSRPASRSSARCNASASEASECMSDAPARAARAVGTRLRSSQGGSDSAGSGSAGSGSASPAGSPDQEDHRVSVIPARAVSDSSEIWGLGCRESGRSGRGAGTARQSCPLLTSASGEAAGGAGSPRPCASIKTSSCEAQDIIVCDGADRCFGSLRARRLSCTHCLSHSLGAAARHVQLSTVASMRSLDTASHCCTQPTKRCCCTAEAACGS